MGLFDTIGTGGTDSGLRFTDGSTIDPIASDIQSVGEPSDEKNITTNFIGPPIYDLLGTGSIKGNFLFSGANRNILANRDNIEGDAYFASWGVGVCIGPTDEIYSIWADDMCIWNGNLERPESGGQVTISLDKEGIGEFAEKFFKVSLPDSSIIVYFGTQDHEPIPDSIIERMYLHSLTIQGSFKDGKIIEGDSFSDFAKKFKVPYRGLCWLFMNDVFIGDSDTIPTIRVVLRKTPELAFNSNHLIETHNYNPAHAIWYILNELTGLPESWLNETNFSNVADTLYGERRGVSILFEKQQKALSYIESINTHIDGLVLYGNDGKVSPKLIRDDYGSSLLTIDENVLLKEPSFKRGSWISTINEMKVMYTELLGPDIHYQVQAVGGNVPGLPFKTPWSYTELTSVDIRGYGYKVFGGVTHTFLIKDDGTLWASGVNTFGELGTGDTVNHKYAFVQIGTDNDWESIYSTSLYTIAIKKDKTIWATGRNYDYSLGFPDIGYLEYLTEFTQIEPDMLIPGTYIPISWEKVAVGVQCNLFLTTEGYLYGCGGATGLGLGADVKTLTLLNSHRWKDIKTSGASSILIKRDGTMWCMGHNGVGQLGLGYSSGVLTLTHNPIGSDWDKLCVGYNTAIFFAIKENGTMWGWGKNNETGVDYSYLGIGVADNYINIPTQESTGSTDWIKVMNGTALKSDGTLWSTGNNTNGQLGISDLVDRYIFTQVTEVSTEWVDFTRNESNLTAIQYSYNVSADEFIDLKASTASPIAIDEGNIAVQSRTVSKSIKMALFTTNENAVWAGRNALQKVSYPYAEIKVPVNRNLFRLEVGDCFYFSYAPYKISNMIYRVVKIKEKDIRSEDIEITAVEDVFGITRVREDYEAPVNNTIGRTSYVAEPFDYEQIIESPYYMSGSATELIPMAGRKSSLDLGFYLYMSIDNGASYFLLDVFPSLMPYGELVGTYSSDIYTIDNSDTGLTIDFDNINDVNQYETTTFSKVLSGVSNTALLGNEIISVQTITPYEYNEYILTDIIRGRYGTEKENHTTGERFYFITQNIMKAIHNEIIPNVTRLFKLVPYNNYLACNISHCAVVGITITGKSKTPYKPINFLANDGSYAARYTDDVILTWSPRFRGKGAGIGTPGDVLPETTREGLFRIEVWVSSVNVRDITNVDSDTWTYTEAMNLSDNGSLASSVTFKLYNFRDEDGTTYESAGAEVICKESL